MTEPLLFGTTLVAIALTADWVDRGAPDWRHGRRGWRSPPACMTRYEAWPICGALLALAFAVLLRRGTPLRAATLRDRPAGGISGGCRSCSSCSTADGRSARGSSAAGSSLRKTRRSASRCSPGIRCERVSIGSRDRRSSGRRTAAQLLIAWTFARVAGAGVAGARSGARCAQRRCPGTRTSRDIRSASATACRSSSRARRSSATGIGLLPRALRAVAAIARRGSELLAGLAARSIGAGHRRVAA